MARRPDMQRTPRANEASRDLSLERLNGQVYTPDDLADAVVARLPLADGARWLDPSCGDGAFLAAAWRRARREGVRIRLTGWDVDDDALAAARRRLAALGDDTAEAVDLLHADALDAEGTFDVVVGNPPYLESKRMPDALKRRVKARCPDAGRGAFDLYGAFLERALAWTGPHGTIALLVPNRVLVSSWARHLRERLLSEGALWAVDLSTSDAFDGAAAVYPVLLGLTRGGSRSWTVEDLGGTAIFRAADAWLQEAPGARLPLPVSGVPGQLLERVLAAGFPSLGDAIDVRWTVSFHRGGLRDRYVFEDRPDSPNARRFLGGGRFAGNREVAPYGITWGGAWIDHDEARARRDRNPLPPAELFEGPRVAIPQNVRRPRAAFVDEPMVFKDTFLLARTVREERWLRWLVHVLHADVTHVLYEQLYGGTRKGGGYLHLLGSYLTPFPLPPAPDWEESERLHTAIVAGEAPWDAAGALVRRAFGVTAEEAAWLDAAELPSP